MARKVWFYYAKLEGLQGKMRARKNIRLASGGKRPKSGEPTKTLASPWERIDIETTREKKQQGVCGTKEQVLRLSLRGGG